MKGFPNLGDMRKTIPAGGLLNPGLRKGYGSKSTLSKISSYGKVQSRGGQLRTKMQKRKGKVTQNFSNIGL